jgi:hypothetical protein
VLASLAASRTNTLKADGESALTALNGGYHVAFALGAVFALAAGVVAAVCLLEARPAREAAGEPALAES